MTITLPVFDIQKLLENVPQTPNFLKSVNYDALLAGIHQAVIPGGMPTPQVPPELYRTIESFVGEDD